MLLAIDIGNSYITIGGYHMDRLQFVSQMLTTPKRARDQYAVELKSIMQLYHILPDDVSGAVISSVVPELTGAVRDAVKMLTGVRILVLGPGIKTGLNILIDNPAQLGADIAACAVGAAAKGHLPCIIYDLGTATTVSVVDEGAKLVGVVISAGIGTTLDMFTSRTALLPHVSLEAPDTVIGKNTIHSMQSGLIYGTAAMIDGLADRIEAEIGKTACLLATGTMAREVSGYCKRDVEVCEYLLLEGLKKIYEKNSRGGY